MTVREGGHVQRCHVLPKVGDYSVGKHSYDALSLLLVLHPDPTRRLICSVLWHDVPERWTGDIPAPVKWGDASIAQGLKRVEQFVYAGLPCRPCLGLTDNEQDWLDAVDKLELFLWCREQEAFGNTMVSKMKDAVESWFARNSHRVPHQCGWLYNKIVQDKHRRLSDELPR